MSIFREISRRHDSSSEVCIKKDDVQTQEQMDNRAISSIHDISFDDIDWDEPFELEEKCVDTADLLQDVANIDWNDDFSSEINATLTLKDHSLEFIENNSFSSKLLEILNEKFGLESFRPGQREIINAILHGHDCFVLMPTGGGKSLCYQLPALLTKGVTIVISPLIALIADQVDKLNALDIRAAHSCSTLTRNETKEVLSKLYLNEPDMDLLYLTPEKIMVSGEFRDALDSLYRRKKLARFVFDEVHCLSLWGHDFRPHYKQLSILRQKYSDIQIICFTATATKQVETDVIVNLKLRNVKRFIQSFNRPNIKYQVIDKFERMPTYDISRLISFKFFRKSGIIYCLTRKDCMILSQYLNCLGIAARPYHAGLEDKIREKTQREWMQNKFHVIVATIAFGMGIDKPDVRFVIHNTIPKSLEAYYQESGRAGRDGEIAYSYLFYSYNDVLRTMKLMDDDFSRKHTLDGHFDNLEQMVAFANNQVDCRRYLQLLNLGENFDRQLCMQNRETICDNCENFGNYIPADIDVTKQAKELSMLIKDIANRNKITLIMATKIYKGSRAKNIVAKRLHKHRYFGMGRTMSRLDIHRILRDLIQKNIIIYDYITTGDFPIAYIKPGPELQTFLNSSDMKMTIPVGRSIQNEHVHTEYATLPCLISRNQSSVAENQYIRNIKISCYEKLLEFCVRFALEKNISASTVLHPLAVKYISENLPRNREELLKIQHVTIATFSKIGKDILHITNQFRNKIHSHQSETVQESEEEIVNDLESIEDISNSRKRTFSQTFS